MTLISGPIHRVLKATREANREPIRFHWLNSLGLVAVLWFSAAPAPAQTAPAKKEQSQTFAISCKVIRAAFETDPNGKQVLEKSTTSLPEIKTLDGSRAEYVSDKKIPNGEYQFKIQLQVQRAGEGKVRVEVMAEDVWSEFHDNYVATLKKSLQCTRLVAVNGKLKLTLMEKTEKGEGIWVELDLKEAPDED